MTSRQVDRESRVGALGLSARKVGTYARFREGRHRLAAPRVALVGQEWWGARMSEEGVESGLHCTKYKAQLC